MSEEGDLRAAAALRVELDGHHSCVGSVCSNRCRQPLNTDELERELVLASIALKKYTREANAAEAVRLGFERRVLAISERLAWSNKWRTKDG